MRGQRNVGAARFFVGKCQHVAGAVNLRFPSEATKLGGHPLGALLFEERGRGDAAKLELYFVNPLLFPREPLQTLPHAAQLRNASNGNDGGREVGRH